MDGGIPEHDQTEDQREDRDEDRGPAQHRQRRQHDGDRNERHQPEEGQPADAAAPQRKSGASAVRGRRRGARTSGRGPGEHLGCRSTRPRPNTSRSTRPSSNNSTRTATTPGHERRGEGGIHLGGWAGLGGHPRGGAVEQADGLAEPVDRPRGREGLAAAHPVLDEEGSPDRNDGDEDQGRGLHATTVWTPDGTPADVARCVADEARVTAVKTPISPVNATVRSSGGHRGHRPSARRSGDRASPPRCASNALAPPPRGTSGARRRPTTRRSRAGC